MDRPYSISDFALPSRWDSDSRPSVIERAGRSRNDDRTRTQEDREKHSESSAPRGVPLERVCVLLGHQSVRVTERHYSPWVRARQEQLEADLQRAFASDPLVLMQTAPPSETGEASQRLN